MFASFAFIIAAVLLVPLASRAQTRQSEIGLVGIWQVSPDIASGWSDNYQFFADGHFVFNSNQMDCAKREISYAGQWRVKGNSLSLYISQRKILEGGRFEQARGSCGSDLVLLGARLKVIDVTPRKLLTLTLAEARPSPGEVYNPITKKVEWRNIQHILIGGTDYWKLRDNPNEY